MRAVCNDWFVALDDIGAEKASDFSVSKLDQIVDARLGKWTVITCNFTRQQIADQMDVRIASRLGRGNNVIVDNIKVPDYSLIFAYRKEQRVLVLNPFYRSTGRKLLTGFQKFSSQRSLKHF